MPAKRPRRSSDAPSWQVILEEIRSQNRATIEAVEASRAALEQRIERLEHGTSTRDAALEMAIRELRVSVHQNGAEIRQLQGDVKVLQGDVRGLSARVEALARLEERVTAIEKRLA